MTSLGIRFRGVRGSYPAAYPTHMRVGGNTPCVELEIGSTRGVDASDPPLTVVLDAGSGIIELGQQLAASGEPGRVVILLTHFHWDHISGLPFFAPAFIPGWQVEIHAPGDDDAKVESLVAAQMKAPFFPVETETWLASVSYRAFDGPLTLGGASVTHFSVQHPGTTFGYRIQSGERTLVYAPDSELALPDKAFDDRRDRFDAEERTLVDAMRAEEAALDSAFMAGVDCLIHDAQYTRAEYQSKRGWGHSCFEDLVRVAVAAKVRHLYLFSHDPTHDDAAMADIETQARLMISELGSPMRCDLAREGESARLS